MSFKAMLFLLASFLLLTTRVSSKDEELFTEAAYAKVPVAAPALAPTVKAPPVKAPPASASPVKAPPASAPPVKAPPAPAPSVTPPTSSPKLPPGTRIECVPLCVERCKLHSRKNICLRACLTCCNRCKCVPPGQYGNIEKCGKCYADMTTRGGRRKCP